MSTQFFVEIVTIVGLFYYYQHYWPPLEYTNPGQHIPIFSCSEPVLLSKRRRRDSHDDDYIIIPDVFATMRNRTLLINRVAWP